MKLTKRKDYTGSIRTVWNDAKTVRIGLIGTVRDFLDAGLFDRCDAPDDRWAFIPALEDGQPWRGTVLLHPRGCTGRHSGAEYPGNAGRDSDTQLFAGKIGGTPCASSSRCGSGCWPWA